MAWENTKVVNSEKIALTVQEKERDRKRRAEIERQHQLAEERERQKAEERRRKEAYEKELNKASNEIKRNYMFINIFIWILGGGLFCYAWGSEAVGWAIIIFFATLFVVAISISNRDEEISKKAASLRATYGVKSKGFCYITTAVCEIEGKNDDCYELKQFRYFRDYYLLEQPDGKALVKVYYETAPKIIKEINKEINEAHKKAVYKHIKERYLDKCLSHIEAKEFEKCKLLYMQMVNELQEKYTNYHKGEIKINYIE